MSDIDESKLLELHKLAEGGKVNLNDPKAVATALGITSRPVSAGKAYAAALVAAYPEVYAQEGGSEDLPTDDSDDTPEPEPEADEDDGLGEDDPEEEEEDDGLGEDEEEEEETSPPAPAPKPVVKPAPAPAKAQPKPAPVAMTTVVREQAPVIERGVLLDENNMIECKLAFVSLQGGVAAWRRVPPKDEVTLILRGQQITVDLEQLKKTPAGTEIHGLPVSRLIDLATLAKG